MPLILLLAALLLPTPARAQTPGTLTVSGTGVVRREPDRAVLLLAVESFAPTAQEAARQNATRMQSLLAALRRQGLSEDQVRTISYELHPEYDFNREPAPGPPPQERLLGFRARNMVQVTVDAVDRVGAIIDAAIEAGANRVAGLNFQLRDPQAARNEALQRAVAVAQAEAEATARALGRRVGPALSVTTTGVFPPPVPLRAESVKTFDAATPIEPGVLEVAATVTIVYALEPAR